MKISGVRFTQYGWVWPLLICLAHSSQASKLSQSESLYLAELQTRAEVLKLSEKRYWRILLHYRRALWGGYKSEVETEKFFNSEDGYSDPKGELRETLRSFFEPPIPPGKENPRKGIEHSQCRFIDRYQWLKKQLRFDSGLLKEQPCPGYLEWKKRLGAQSATLVFASYYLHNPSSVMGHTLLRLNRTSGKHRSKLLDYGVNYAAVETNQNVLIYSLLGLFGGLPGLFSNMPYYVKVGEYNNLESRDLWEYDLSLTQKQVDRMQYHLWAIGHVAFPYYFLDKNCSYMLLTLIEAAEPSYSLSGELPGWAIPSDTIKIVMRQKGLVTNVVYRPSLATRIVKRRERMNDRQDEILLKITKDPDSWEETKKELKALPPEEASVVADTAREFLQFKNLEWKKDQGGEQKVEAGVPKLKKIRRELSVLRSKIGHPGLWGFLTAETEAHARPDRGHGSFRLSMGGGYNLQAEAFTELGFRFAFHDLNAINIGYPRTAKIEIMNIRTRFYPTGTRFKLESAKLVDVASITPMDRLFGKSSWAFSMGVETVRDFDCGECNQFRLDGGTGYAFDLSKDQLTLYALAKMEAAFSGYFDSSVRIGPGATGGLLFNLVDELSFWTEGSVYFPLLGHTGIYAQSSVEGRFSPELNQEIRLRYDQYLDNYELLGYWNLYF